MATRTIPVKDALEFDATVAWFQGQGYALTWYAPPAATLVRSSSISCVAVLLLIFVGWLFLWIPLFIYLIWFAANNQELVSVYIYSPPWALTPHRIDVSEDGLWWWDGSAWQSTTVVPVPPQ